jgi:anthranilate synthase component 1
MLIWKHLYPFFKRFEDSENCFLLESVEGGEKWARYSFIGKNPFLVTKSYGDTTYLEYKDGKKEEIKGNPINTLKDLMSRYNGAEFADTPRFNGGAVGYFAYDLIRHFEKLPDMPEDDLNMPESHFMFMDEVLSFDHLKQKVHIIVNLHRNGNIDRDYATTTQRIKDIYEEIISSRWKINDTMINKYSEDEKLEYTSNITKEQFCKNVEKAKEYIKDGDIFQVVPSQRLAVKTDKKPF